MLRSIKNLVSRLVWQASVTFEAEIAFSAIEYSFPASLSDQLPGNTMRYVHLNTIIEKLALRYSDS